MRFVPGVVALSKKTEPAWWFVFRGDKLLIPGETLEECVRREVKEEVGIEVENICYFGSQSWPFPNSLMVAFTPIMLMAKLPSMKLRLLMQAGLQLITSLPYRIKSVFLDD